MFKRCLEAARDLIAGLALQPSMNAANATWLRNAVRCDGMVSLDEIFAEQSCNEEDPTIPAVCSSRTGRPPVVSAKHSTEFKFDGRRAAEARKKKKSTVLLSESVTSKCLGTLARTEWRGY